MLLNPLSLFLLVAPALAAPADKRPAITFPSCPTPAPIGLDGQPKRTISLCELEFYGGWDGQPGCGGQSRRSNGRAATEAYAGLFDESVIGAIISRTRSTSEQIFIGAGQVWNLSPANGTFTVGCPLSHAIAFTGPRIAPVPATLFPDGPLRGKPSFGFVNVPAEAPTFQRQWAQVDQVTLYGSYSELMAATEGYDRVLYTGGI